MQLWNTGRVVFAIVCGFASFAANESVAAGASQASNKWRLTWSDEFDGDEVDRTKWDFDIGNGFYSYTANMWISGWGNEELQYYTDRPKNALVDDGKLRIRALKESLHQCGFTSARLKTRKQDGSPLFNQKYGRFEFRAKLPTGKGVWPALWMLPQDETYGTWPASGEIDVMEAKGHEPQRVLGSMHYGACWPNNTHTSNEYLLAEDDSIANFHVYALEWEPGELRWYVDDTLHATETFWWSSSKTDGSNGVNPTKESDLNRWPAPFDQPFCLVMNVAIGGKFGGLPNESTEFPAEMVVDYVRAYEKVDGYSSPKPRSNGKLPFAAR